MSNPEISRNVKQNSVKTWRCEAHHTWWVSSLAPKNVSSKVTPRKSQFLAPHILLLLRLSKMLSICPTLKWPPQKDLLSHNSPSLALKLWETCIFSLWYKNHMLLEPQAYEIWDFPVNGENIMFSCTMSYLHFLFPNYPSMSPCQQQVSFHVNKTQKFEYESSQQTPNPTTPLISQIKNFSSLSFGNIFLISLHFLTQPNRRDSCKIFKINLV